MKRILLLIALVCTASLLHTALAFDTEVGTTDRNLGFTTLDWNELKIDSVLPVYSEVVPLESDYADNTYTVSVLYPEFAPLNKRETEVAEKYSEKISDQIVVESHVGVTRRVGMIDISFVPIVKRDGKYMKLLSAQIVITPHACRQVAKAPAGSSRYVQHSKLQSGRWVKISVAEDGIYRLTRSQLRSMGFSNPEKVHLYGHGGHLLPEMISRNTHEDDLVEVPLYRSEKQDAWLFWGNGTLHWEGDDRIRNCYSVEGFYFLTEEENPSSIQTVASSTATPDTVYNSFRDHVLYEKEEYSWYSGGRQLYDYTNYALGNSHTYKLNTINSVGNEQLFVNFTGSSLTSFYLNVYVNGKKMNQDIQLDATDVYILATEGSRMYDVGNFENGPEWNVKLVSPSGVNARLDRLELHYERLLKPESGYVAFSQPEGSGVGQFNIQGTGLHVMKIGSLNNPATMIDGSQDGSVYSFRTSEPNSQFVAFDDAYAFPSPKVIGSVENQDLHAVDSLDMVIIIPASGKLKEQARRLAEAHEKNDGLRVGIFRADQIYNEFSSGTPDATAYRLFMKMLYDRAKNLNDAPRYLLLFGDCAWDNRMISTAWRKSNPDDYLLCYESINSFNDVTCYVMEDYFGLLDDGEGKSPLYEKVDIGVGRFPVTTSTQAKVMVDKSIAFMSNQYAGNWKNQVYILGDDGDQNEHMDYANKIADLINSRNPNIEVHKVMWDAYTRVSSTSNNTYPEANRLIKKQMTDGALVMNYTGHAATYGFSHEFVILKDDFSNSESNRLPLWVTAACEVMPFDGQITNIGEEAVLNPKGGAVAFYGTTRTVYASQNYSMNRFFMQSLFATDNQGRRNTVGDALRLAKVAIVTSGYESGHRENKVHYCLLGDPALVFGEPLQHVVLDSINSVSVKKGQMPLKAGQHVRLVGHVEDNSGSLLTNFTGSLSTRLFDSEQTVVCKNNASADKAFTFRDRNSLLFDSQDSIINGRFELQFVIPVDINYSDESGRFVFYAVSDSSRIEANGYHENIPLGGIVDDLTSDQEGPKIYAYLNHEDFQNGGKVNATPYFVAHVEDQSGVNASGNGVGHDLQLCIDGKADKTYLLNEYYAHEFGDYTRGTVAYTIPVLEPGKHTLTFRAWDMLNNTSQTQLDFVVDETVPTSILQLTASQNPAITNTNFLLTYDLPGSDCQMVMEVFDSMGRCLWSREENVNSSTGFVSIPWNLSTGQGGRVGPGIYFYRCRIKTGSSEWSTKTQKIVVLHNK